MLTYSHRKVYPVKLMGFRDGHGSLEFNVVAMTLKQARIMGESLKEKYQASFVEIDTPEKAIVYENHE